MKGSEVEIKPFRWTDDAALEKVILKNNIIFSGNQEADSSSKVVKSRKGLFKIWI